MTLALTLMIRDEADILPAWIDYHVAQGVDVFIITDNGSEDGSTALLEDFAARADDLGVVVDLRHDPVHRKQQGQVVTQMARDAASQHGADWVVNADADEFLIAKDRSLRLGHVFSRLDQAVGAFFVPVINLIGRMAESGTGLERLHWRDERSPSELLEIGLLAHPTPNTIHIGDPEVTVVQGNHRASVAAGDPVPTELELEVLHLPWRSWAQYEHRVEIAGRAYEANPDLAPSPNHHGMRDYRRLHEGVLRGYFALRVVSEQQAEAGSFTRDDSLADYLRNIGSLDAHAPEEDLTDEAEVRSLAAYGRALVRRDRQVADATERATTAAENVRLWQATANHERTRADELQGRVTVAERELEAMHARRVVRLADQVGDFARRFKSR